MKTTVHTLWTLALLLTLYAAPLAAKPTFVQLTTPALSGVTAPATMTCDANTEATYPYSIATASLATSYYCRGLGDIDTSHWEFMNLNMRLVRNAATAVHMQCDCSRVATTTGPWYPITAMDTYNDFIAHRVSTWTHTRSVSGYFQFRGVPVAGCYRTRCRFWTTAGDTDTLYATVELWRND